MTTALSAIASIAFAGLCLSDRDKRNNFGAANAALLSVVCAWIAVLSVVAP